MAERHRPGQCNIGLPPTRRHPPLSWHTFCAFLSFNTEGASHAADATVHDSDRDAVGGSMVQPCRGGLVQHGRPATVGWAAHDGRDGQHLLAAPLPQRRHVQHVWRRRRRAAAAAAPPSAAAPKAAPPSKEPAAPSSAVLAWVERLQNSAAPASLADDQMVEVEVDISGAALHMGGWRR